jgi:hypothetical protein
MPSFPSGTSAKLMIISDDRKRLPLWYTVFGYFQAGECQKFAGLRSKIRTSILDPIIYLPAQQ